MKIEEFEELKDKVSNAQIIIGKIDTAEYLITLLSNGAIKGTLKTAIFQKSVSSSKENTAILLNDIDISAMENEIVEMIIQKFRERRENLLAELESY